MPEARDRPLVEIELVSDSIAVATLHGEHDLSTARDVATGLDRACEKADVIVDLRRCAFLDLTVISRLLSAYRNQVERDGRLELVIPSDPSHVVLRVLRFARVHELLVVHETREAALAGMLEPAVDGE